MTLPSLLSTPQKECYALYLTCLCCFAPGSSLRVNRRAKIYPKTDVSGKQKLLSRTSNHKVSNVAGLSLSKIRDRGGRECLGKRVN